MADTKSTENKDTKTEDKISESETKEEIKYTLLRNVKYGSTPYKAGDKIAIREEDLEEFKKAGAIKIE
jgi:hypothetical protein